MKKGLFLLLLLLLLTGCIPTALPNVPATLRPTLPPTAHPTLRPTLSPTIPLIPTPTVFPTAFPTPPFHMSTEAFDISDKCPHVCWLGINPGVTTAEKARSLLKASDQMDQNTFQDNGTYISADWFFVGRRWSCQAVVYFSQGLVKTIGLGGTMVTMNEVISVLGEPDKIKIGVSITPHGEKVIGYALYYSSRKTLLYVASRGWDGPNPNDNVNTIILNTNEFGFESDTPQPWLGYGHIREYLPGESLPTSPSDPLPTSTP